jgi:hypothetical protein
MTAKEIAERYTWTHRNNCESDITALIAEAVAAEREACARVVDMTSGGAHVSTWKLALLIRARSDPPYPFGVNPDGRQCGCWSHTEKSTEWYHSLIERDEVGNDTYRLMQVYRHCPFCGAPRKEQR